MPTKRISSIDNDDVQIRSTRNKSPISSPKNSTNNDKKTETTLKRRNRPSFSSSKKRRARKKMKIELRTTFNLGSHGERCDVCFEQELPCDPVPVASPNPFIKCNGCELLVHVQCFPPSSEIDENGIFTCDVCLVREKIEANGNQSEKNNKKTEEVSNIPQFPDPVEAEDDGRVYRNDPNINPVCILCLRSDVAGGMKQTLFNKKKDWAHLACTLSTQDCHISVEGKILGFMKAIQRNKEEIEDEWGIEPICEICQKPGGYLINCSHICEEDKKSEKKPLTRPFSEKDFMDRRCNKFIHPLCAELAERERVVVQVRAGGDDVILYKCANHSSGYEKCVVCSSACRPNQILECDGCRKGYHMDCLNPKLTEIPADDWFCDDCANRRSPTTVTI